MRAADIFTYLITAQMCQSIDVVVTFVRRSREDGKPLWAATTENERFHVFLSYGFAALAPESYGLVGRWPAMAIVPGEAGGAAYCEVF